MPRLLLVRHAQSEWNALGRWQGLADPPLSDLGELQAAHAAGRLGGFDAIVSSPLQRAVATAATLAERLGIGPVLTVDELAERDAGEWTGLTRTQIEERWPGYLARRQMPPGFESEAAVELRIGSALDHIVEAVGGDQILVVTHGGVIYSLERMHGEPFERIPNLGGRWVEVDGDHRQLGERVLLVDAEELTIPSQL